MLRLGLIDGVDGSRTRGVQVGRGWWVMKAVKFGMNMGALVITICVNS
jgi:hypothetical protein